MKKNTVKITNFQLKTAQIISDKYEVVSKLGSGWEGEVYKIREMRTGIERAAKLFFPQRNINHKASCFYARKLHKLRKCQILIQYHTEETLYFDGLPITMLVSEYVEGQLLSDFVRSFPGKKLTPFQALHLLYSLVKGIEDIHLLNEYHGDLHSDNVIVNRFGLYFELKLLDMFHWSSPSKANREDDLCELIHIFYDSLGGAKYYSKFPQEIKKICCGLKKGLILKKFRTVSQLREYLETMKW
ncbi:MAG: protein kinase [Candidatus Omnitrophica bacterium]|nr:protein kinase [Candidatus Omnitrophota bacterium]